MQIILLESIERVGKAGEIVAVKDGYANNFLLPKKLAIVANKKNRSELDTKMDSISKQNDVNPLQTKKTRPVEILVKTTKTTLGAIPILPYVFSFQRPEKRIGTPLKNIKTL